MPVERPKVVRTCGVFIMFASRALVRHHNFQKCSQTVSFSHFCSTTAACTFSTSQLPKVLRSWCVFTILTSKCASRQAACTFSTSQLSITKVTKRSPELRCFYHFDSDFQMCFATFLPFCALWSWFFLLTLSLLISFLFGFFLFSDCSHHCCCICS